MVLIYAHKDLCTHHHKVIHQLTYNSPTDMNSSPCNCKRALNFLKNKIFTIRRTIRAQPIPPTKQIRHMNYHFYSCVRNTPLRSIRHTRRPNHRGWVAQLLSLRVRVFGRLFIDRSSHPFKSSHMAFRRRHSTHRNFPNRPEISPTPPNSCHIIPVIRNPQKDFY